MNEEQTVLEALKISKKDSDKDGEVLKKIFNKSKTKAVILKKISYLDIPEIRKLYMALAIGGFIEKQESTAAMLKKHLG